LDSELEQLLCFDTVIDAERFCSEKTALFVILPEEDPSATRSQLKRLGTKKINGLKGAI